MTKKLRYEKNKITWKKKTKCNSFKTNFWYEYENDQMVRLCSRFRTCFNYNPETCFARLIETKVIK